MGLRVQGFGCLVEVKRVPEFGAHHDVGLLALKAVYSAHPDPGLEIKV